MNDRARRIDQQIVLTANGLDYRGWISQQFTRSIEAVCGTFAVTARFDALLQNGVYQQVKAGLTRGQQVQISLDGRLLMTGFIDASKPKYSRDTIELIVTGRDITCDLVDSSAIYQGGEWRNATVGQIAQDLCRAHGISVREQVTTEPLRLFRLNTGETAADAIARAASHRGLLVYTSPTGELVITRGDVITSRGRSMSRPEAIVSLELSDDDSELYHRYLLRAEGDIDSDEFEAVGVEGQAIDPLIRKNRVLIIDSENSATATDLAARAADTVRRRRGRSRSVMVDLVGWADKDGEPWQVEELVAVRDAVAGIDENLVMAELSFDTSRAGSAVSCVLKPASAFDQEPVPEDSGEGSDDEDDE